MFVCLADDLNRNQEYLFSTSVYDSITELWNLESSTYATNKTRTIFNTLDIFSYEFSLIELKESNQFVYFIAFTEHEEDREDGKDYSKKFKVVKFKFTSFNLNDGFKLLAEYIDYNNYDDRIVSAFLLEKHNLLAVLYIKIVPKNNNDYYSYYIVFLDYNLVKQGENELYEIGWNYYDLNPGNGVYFKAIYLKDDLVIFLFYLHKKIESILYLRVNKYNSSTKDFKDNKFSYDKDFYFYPDIILNDFFKIDDTHLVYITSKDDYKSSYFLFMDFNNDYSKLKMRLFHHKQPNDVQFIKEFKGYIYNGFFTFTSTVAAVNSDEYYSILLFYGYPNGTDFEIDISPYLMDTGNYQPENNLFNRLMLNLTVENNIFQYDIVQKINLVYIPNELIFYNVTNSTKDETPLPNDTFFDADHKLYQNRALNNI